MQAILRNGDGVEKVEREVRVAALAERGRPDLEACRRACLMLARAKARLPLGDAPEIAELRARIELQQERLIDACEGLSVLERILVTETASADEQLLRTVVEAGRRFVRTEGEQVAPLPDLVDGVRWIPDDLERYFSLGGQTRQSLHGPIVSWAVAFEPPLPERILASDESAEVGLAKTARRGSIVPYDLVFHESGEQLPLRLRTRPRTRSITSKPRCSRSAAVRESTSSRSARNGP